MSKQSATRRAFQVGLLALAFVGTILPTSAMASSYNATLAATDSQLVLTQKMTKEALLVTLGIDKAKNLEGLRNSSAEFQELLSGLRNGDQRLKLKQMSNIEVLGKLDQIDELWQMFSVELQAVLDAGQVSNRQMETIARLEPLLGEAIKAMVKTYRAHNRKIEVGSLHLITKRVAGGQPLLAHKMFKEFLLIAFGYEVPVNKMNLTETYSRFDRTLQALIHGDSEMNLIPAPNPSVEAQLNRAQQLWSEFRPVIKSVVKSGTVDPEQLTQVVSRNVPLVEAVNKAVKMY